MRGWLALVGVGLLIGAAGLMLFAWLSGDPGGRLRTTDFGRSADLAAPSTALLAGWVLVPLLAVLVAVAMWRWSRLLAVTAVGGVVCVAVVLVLLLVSGHPGPGYAPGNQVALALPALIGAGVGTVLVGIGAYGARPRPVSVMTLPVAGLVVVIAAGVLVDVRIGDSRHVDATTAAPTAPAALPTSHLRPAWQRTFPGEEAYEIRAAGAGVVVWLSSGIVALDGTTGGERWHYRRDDIESVTGVHVFDSGRTVVLGFTTYTGVVDDEPYDQPAHHHSLVAFDAFTGEQLWQSTDPVNGMENRITTTETAQALIVARVNNYEPTSVEARDPRTNALLWQRPITASSCESGEYPVTTSDVVVMRCDAVAVKDWAGSSQSAPTPPGVTVAVDARDGRELWRLTAPGDKVLTGTENGFIGVQTPQGELRALNARTGIEISGPPRLGAGYSDPHSSDVLVGDQGADQKTLNRLESQGPWHLVDVNGSVRWTNETLELAETGGLPFAFLPDAIAAIAADGGVRGDGDLLLLDRATGTALLTPELDDWNRSHWRPWQLAPVAAPGSLVAAQFADGFDSTTITGFR
ncbi:PQQ-binding-like beta-propeller repeat protein [Saccharopolyspora sp. NPDC050389]|uniref:outer membrane protein assembly factor BamB family protein n=1 Tax=Saccharopolyspora sp. NPDC050389 TaxID=3155516 RepID=UPI0033E28B16